MIEYRLRDVNIKSFFTLSNIEFVPEGKHVRISGRTGAGKTTAIGAILHAFSWVDTKGHKRVPGAVVDFALMGESVRRYRYIRPWYIHKHTMDILLF